MKWFIKTVKTGPFIAGGSSGYDEEPDWNKIRFIILLVLIIIILIKVFT